MLSLTKPNRSTPPVAAAEAADEHLSKGHAQGATNGSLYNSKVQFDDAAASPGFTMRKSSPSFP
jgi:hypothetical protein